MQVVMTMFVATTLSALIVKQETDTDANAEMASQATLISMKDVKVTIPDSSSETHKIQTIYH